jgi:serine/threonine-protein kinase
VGEQADVYSLATIAYYLLCGALPFTGKNPRELFQQLLQENPVPLNQAVKGMKFSPAVEDVVMKGLARDRGERYKTVDDFTAAFCTAAREEKKKGGFLTSLFGRD